MFESGSKMVIVVPEGLEGRVRDVARLILRAPFTKRTWSEFLFLGLGIPLAAFGLAFVALTMAAGVALAVTFIGLAVIGLSVRGARGIGGFHRGIARRLLDEHIDDPDPFASRPGFLGWLQSALRDRTGWRALAYVVLKAPLAILGILTAFSVWFGAFACLTYPFEGGRQPGEFGAVRVFFRPGYLLLGTSGFFHGVAILATGVFLFFAAPWVARVVVLLDRSLMRSLLAPDAMSVRVRSLEHARAQTVDASVATLRQIERDLHDGTQAQLVALAMQLGMAKEKLADVDHPDLEQVRDLVNDAHRGAKEAIVELRDLARGIHPPALDVGLEGALATLAARSTVPTELTLLINDRPTPAIEAIAYFCVAELLANVAQHARASRASITCAQHGAWLRLVVRDDGLGGARPAQLGSSSSGLIGLTDRVRAVDGRFDIVSPLRGPTVVTVDLPLHA
jgi:signal transduction histidine kinase